jgi:hypothetical protein
MSCRCGRLRDHNLITNAPGSTGKGTVESGTAGCWKQSLNSHYVIQRGGGRTGLIGVRVPLRPRLRLQPLLQPGRPTRAGIRSDRGPSAPSRKSEGAGDTGSGGIGRDGGSATASQALYQLSYAPVSDQFSRLTPYPIAAAIAHRDSLRSSGPVALRSTQSPPRGHPRQALSAPASRRRTPKIFAPNPSRPRGTVTVPR